MQCSPVDPHDLPVAEVSELCPRFLADDGAVVRLNGRVEQPPKQFQPTLEHQEPHPVRVYLADKRIVLKTFVTLPTHELKYE